MPSTPSAEAILLVIVERLQKRLRWSRVPPARSQGEPRPTERIIATYREQYSDWHHWGSGLVSRRSLSLSVKR